MILYNTVRMKNANTVSRSLEQTGKSSTSEPVISFISKGCRVIPLDMRTNEKMQMKHFLYKKRIPAPELSFAT